MYPFLSVLQTSCGIFMTAGAKKEDMKRLAPVLVPLAASIVPACLAMASFSPDGGGQVDDSVFFRDCSATFVLAAAALHKSGFLSHEETAVSIEEVDEVKDKDLD
jgi:hypothetical protein